MDKRTGKKKKTTKPENKEPTISNPLSVPMPKKPQSPR
jgi:hypothetical protein